MTNADLSRRVFLASAASSTALGAVERPAALGGAKARTTRWPSWPVFDKKEEEALLATLRSGHWYRGSGAGVAKFEKSYAELTGAKACLATANGTSALVISLSALGVGAGDEVIVPPYTFVATVNAVLMHSALPVFVDSDRETSQIDAQKIEASITPRTVAIMPVHLGGSAADIDAIKAVAAKHNLPIVEDACQSHLGEWRGKKVGTYGTTGCFSFQASKNLNSGEGGAILSNDEELIEKCYAFHNNSRGRKSGGLDFSYLSRGANLRMTEFQAALLLAQMSRVEAQSSRRSENAAYLTSMLKEIPGIRPARMYEGCTRNAYHLYMLRYEKEKFANLARAKFLKALGAEGIPASGGYAPLNREPFLKNTLHSRGFERVFGKARLAQWERANLCPQNDLLCQEAVWFTQNMLIGARSDMEQIVEAIRKIQAYASDLAKA